MGFDPSAIQSCFAWDRNQAEQYCILGLGACLTPTMLGRGILTLQMGWSPTLGGGAMRLVEQGNTDNMLVLQPMMVEELGAKYGFSWVYQPPQDGEWGARQEDGNMSGLIGQAGTNNSNDRSSRYQQ